MQNQQHRDSTSYTENASRRLWDRFAEMFGARFYDQYGSEPSGAWKDAVKELRPDQVKAALTKIRNSGSSFPPSLPEFLSLAKNVSVPKPVEERKPDFDYLHLFAQRCFLKFILTHGPFDESVIRAMVNEKNRLVADYRSIATEDELTAEEVRESLFASFRKHMVTA